MQNLGESRAYGSYNLFENRMVFYAFFNTKIEIYQRVHTYVGEKMNNT